MSTTTTTETCPACTSDRIDPHGSCACCIDCGKWFERDCPRQCVPDKQTVVLMLSGVDDQYSTVSDRITQLRRLAEKGLRLQVTELASDPAESMRVDDDLAGERST